MSREKSELLQISGRFAIDGELENIEPHGNGHINDTFLLTCRAASGEKCRYILQRMNHEVFKDPRGLMENIVGVTAFLQKKIAENGGDPRREALNVIPVADGGSYRQEEDGTFWRMYRFVENAVSYDVVERPEDFYESAVAFGHFQKLLADFPADTLYESIPNFHNTKARFLDFEEAVARNACGRAASVAREIAFVRGRREFASVLVDMQERGELPLRVTHNDTKLNNVLMDDKTGEGMCIIDLDTVMPGLVLYDFGDSIRFGANHCAEDETDLSKVSLDVDLFATYTAAFLEGTGGSLTSEEIAYLPWGAKLMTLECGIRFLTDYLAGDQYFHISREGQNLDRCRTQFKLVADMEAHWAELEAIAGKYLK